MMKKIALVMSLVFVLGLFAGCGNPTATTEPQEDTANVTAPSAEQEAYTKKAATEADLDAAMWLKKPEWKEEGVTKINIDIVDTSEFYSWGGYSTEGVNGFGVFYAFNSGENKRWEIIFAGNNDPTCEEIKDYSDFPIEWMPRCRDEKGETVARTQG